MELHKRFALGTVQFGLSYGVSHDGGRVSRNEARAILDLAATSGVDMIDTANAYGDSEEVVGEIAGADQRFAVVTKTLPIRAAVIDAAAVDRLEAAFHQSLKRLRRARVDALLVHDAGDILNPGGENLWMRLAALRRQGLIGKLGASIYDRAEIDATLARYPIEIVQLPLSAFDQRLVADGTLARLAEKGVEVHARSILLQGLLLMTPEAAQPRVPRALEPLRAWRETLAQAGVSPLAAALGFALARKEIDRLTIGVHSAVHLAECLAAARAAPALEYARFACNDVDVVDPRRWTS